MLNLLRDACFPVIRKNGETQRLALAALTEPENLTGNPVVGFRTPRPDLDAATYTFAIAILQTALLPNRQQDWDDYFEAPPSPKQLSAALETHAPAFNLYGEGARFMQDLQLDDQGEGRTIDGLLIDTPGANAAKGNTDFFQKRAEIQRMSPFYAAISLFALQSMAPSGGKGHRTSLRGGGPVQTLVVPESDGTALWHTLWMNVLPQPLVGGQRFNDYLNPTLEHFYPWLTPTSTSEAKSGNVIHHDQRHPLQVLWAMPRRIRLQAPGAAGNCDVSGDHCQQTVTTYVSKPYGNNYYSAGWDHPLSPHYISKEAEQMPVLGQPDMNQYHQWLGFTLGHTDKTDKDVRVPAAVVSQASHRRRNFSKQGIRARIWVSGFDMDNAKPREWIDQTMPFFLPDESNSGSIADFKKAVKGLIETARANGQTLTKAYNTALANNQKGKTDFVQRTYWFETERHFYACLQKLQADPKASQPREDWLKQIQQEAHRLFDHYLEMCDFASLDGEKVFEARYTVLTFASYHNKALRNLMGLDPIQDKDKKKR